MKTNVLILSELFYPHGSGAELATYLYANILGESGFNVIVVTNRFVGEPGVSKSGNSLTNRSFVTYRLPLFKSEGKYSILKRFDVLFSSYMRRLMKWADVVYVPRFWYAAILLAKACRKPIVTHLHDYIPICPLATFYDASKCMVCNSHSILCSPKCVYFFERTKRRGLAETLTSIALNSTLGRYFGELVRLSDAIVCVSKAQRDMIVREEPSLRDKTCVIYNPLPEISCTQPEGDDFGYYGGADLLKGFHILCQAMMRISHVNRRITKVHATKFADSSRQFVRSLSELGVLLYGKLDSEEYDKLYRQIRAVIVPSIWCEPWPYVVVEAIVRGRFLIASRIGGIPEQVEGCKGALLFETGNYKQLAESIESVRSLKRETIIDLGFQNRETFSRRFDSETTIRRFISVYDDLI